MDLTEHKPARKHTAADLIFDEQFKKWGGGWRDAQGSASSKDGGERKMSPKVYILRDFFLKI
jgi:hypothetical protein